jgi:hypothetical protein
MKKLTTILLLTATLACPSYGMESEVIPSEVVPKKNIHPQITYIKNMVRLYHEDLERDIPYQVEATRIRYLQLGVRWQQGIDLGCARALNESYALVKSYQSNLIWAALYHNRLDISLASSISLPPRRYVWEGHSLKDTAPK